MNQALISSRRATFKDIIQAEDNIKSQTQKDYLKWFIKFVQAQDIMLNIMYLETVIPEDMNSPEYYFHAWVHDLLTQIPLSLSSCSLLMESGYYGDSLNLLRSLLENVVKAKYFLDHKQKLEPFEKSGGTNIPVKRMWEHVAGRDSYEKIYKLWSKFEHKNFGTGLPRINSKLDPEGRFPLIPVFNKEFVQVNINSLLCVVLCCLKLQLEVFSFNSSAETQCVLKKHAEIIKDFENVIKIQREDFPVAEAFYSAMEAIYKSKN